MMVVLPEYDMVDMPDHEVDVQYLRGQLAEMHKRLTAAKALAEAAKNVVVDARTGEVIDPLLLIELVTALNQYQETTK